MSNTLAPPAPRVRPLWRSDRHSYRAERSTDGRYAVVRTDGLAAISDLHGDDGDVKVLREGHRPVILTARPAVFPRHGAIPYLDGDETAIVWTSLDPGGKFVVARAHTGHRVAEVVGSLLTEQEAVAKALQIAAGARTIR